MMGLGVKEVDEVTATLEVIDDTLAYEVNSRTNVANSANFDNSDNSKIPNFDNFINFDNSPNDNIKI